MKPDPNIIEAPKLDFEPDPRGLGHAFYWKMKQFENKIAQIDALTGVKETYASFLQRCVRASLTLRAKGVTPEDIVMLCSFNNMDCSVPYVASLFLGSKISALDPTLSVSDVVHLLHEATPKVIFVMEEAVDLIEQAVSQSNLNIEIAVFGKTSKYTPFSDFQKSSDKEEEFRVHEVSNSHDTAIILFSSGTSGLPKGICLTHHHFHSQVENLIRLKYDFRITLVPTSLYWLTANMITTMSILMGHTRILIPKFEITPMLETINKHKPTFMFVTPVQLIDIYNHGIPKEISVDSLKQILTGGTPVLATQVTAIRSIFPKANFLICYGQTEVVMTTAFIPEDEKFVLSNGAVSSGKPVPGFTYRIANIETGESLGPHQQGELRLKTQFKMGGYYNRDWSEIWDSDGWYMTGDIAYYDENHCFYIVDRIKEMLKYRTWHVPPAAIENVLLTHPAVEKCLVIGIPHDIDGDHPMGIVVLKESHKETTSEEIKKFVNDRVDDRKQLRGGLKIVESFPIQPTGKVKKWLIRNMVRRGEL